MTHDHPFDIYRWSFDTVFMLSRILTLLQLTRMALVFTAISNGWAAMLLQSRATGQAITVPYAIAMTLASIGLYTFGMALNDVIDRRRDSQIAPGRPLPSGRISVRSAHALCFVLAVASVAAGGWMVWLHPGQWMTLLIVLWTLALIGFYDFAGKYLVAAGLLTLGLIRFFHATIAAPTLAFPWHAVLLLTHVTLLSAVCYHLEGKRPRLTPKHWLTLSLGLAAVVVTLVTLLIYRRGGGSGAGETPLLLALWIRPGLAYVGAAVVTFVAVAITLRLKADDARAAGRGIMLYGVLWLIVYDASFVVGYVGWRPALIILSLLPLAWLAVQAMRAWAKMVDLSAKPEYQRAR